MFLSNGKATGVATTWCNCGICVLFLCASNLLTLVQETKSFLTLDKKTFGGTGDIVFRGYRQNEVEMLPNWFIYRKEEISLVKAMANKKGFWR